jgi:hypothetical protein
MKNPKLKRFIQISNLAFSFFNKLAVIGVLKGCFWIAIYPNGRM